MSKSELYLLTGVMSGLMAIYSFASYYTFSGEQLIDASDAKKKIKDGSIKTIIDVRTNPEWKLGHYKSAIHIPVSGFTKKKFNKFNKNDGVLVYCNTGQRARNAAEKLKSYGFKNVYYISSTYKSLE